MQEFLVPLVHDFSPLGLAAPGAHSQGHALVIYGHGGLGFMLLDIQEVAPTPEVVALAGDKPAGRFPCLTSELLLLVADPAELGDGVGSGHL